LPPSEDSKAGAERRPVRYGGLRANLRAALALYFAYYNFCKVHKSIRMTPVMAAGIARKPWTMSEVLSTITSCA
jgi:hypothetical protein